jgi:hypothetical protein
MEPQPFANIAQEHFPIKDVQALNFEYVRLQKSANSAQHDLLLKALVNWHQTRSLHRQVV